MSATLALDLRAATAANLCGWHAVSLRALGIPEERSADAWRALAPAPGFYFRWIGLRAPLDASERAAQEQQAGHDHPPQADGWVSDPWAALDLSPFGMRRGHDQSWMVRGPGSVARAGERPGAAAPATPPELEIVRVGDADGLAAFEAVSAAGFEAGPVERFAWHAPGVLEDERFVAWMGLRAGVPVSVAMSFVEAGVVGVYGVATIPEARRRGYGAALTWRALSVEPLPAVLQPSAMAEALYERLGFERFGSFATWFPPADDERSVAGPAPAAVDSAVDRERP